MLFGNYQCQQYQNSINFDRFCRHRRLAHRAHRAHHQRHQRPHPQRQQHQRPHPQRQRQHQQPHLRQHQRHEHNRLKLIIASCSRLFHIVSLTINLLPTLVHRAHHHLLLQLLPLLLFSIYELKYAFYTVLILCQI